MSIETLFNPFSGKLQLANRIPQLTSDPTSPLAEDAWILATISGGSGGGKPIGLLLSLTTPNTGGSSTYKFSYRTKESTTVRATLS